MARAKVKKPFDGVADGEVYPKRFSAGDVVEGKLADVAVAEGWAEPVRAPEPDKKSKQSELLAPNSAR